MFKSYTLLIKVGLVIAALLAAWLNGRMSGANAVQQKWDVAKVEYAAMIESAKATALTKERELTAQRDIAIKGRDEREKANRILATAATTANNGLRDTLATIRSSVPSDSIETLRHRADTLAVLLGECTREYRGLGESADRHANDVQTFDEAWPVVPTPPTAQE